MHRLMNVYHKNNWSSHWRRGAACRGSSSSNGDDEPQGRSKYSPMSVAHLSIILRGYVLHNFKRRTRNWAAGLFSSRENSFREGENCIKRVTKYLPHTSYKELVLSARRLLPPIWICTALSPSSQRWLFWLPPCPWQCLLSHVPLPRFIPSAASQERMPWLLMTAHTSTPGSSQTTSRLQASRQPSSSMAIIGCKYKRKREVVLNRS